MQVTPEKYSQFVSYGPNPRCDWKLDDGDGIQLLSTSEETIMRWKKPFQIEQLEIAGRWSVVEIYGDDGFVQSLKHPNPKQVQVVTQSIQLQTEVLTIRLVTLSSASHSKPGIFLHLNIVGHFALNKPAAGNFNFDRVHELLKGTTLTAGASNLFTMTQLLSNMGNTNDVSSGFSGGFPPKTTISKDATSTEPISDFNHTGSSLRAGNHFDSCHTETNERTTKGEDSLYEVLNEILRNQREQNVSVCVWGGGCY